MGESNVLGLVVAGVVTVVTTVITFLLQGKKKWELEIYKNSNQELREQAAFHLQQKTELLNEKHKLEYQVETKDILIHELKDMAQQVPAFAKLSEQQAREHKEVTTILGGVAQSLTNLVKEIKGKKYYEANRRSTTES